MSAAVGHPVFAVLAVCTGNVCRSPALELRLRAALGASPDVTVTSAGLHARVGEAVDPGMVRLLGNLTAGFRARQVTPELVRSADLVLTMTRDQRRDVVAAAPTALRRTFTLLEFSELARLAADDGVAGGAGTPGEALRALVGAAPRFRAERVSGKDDIGDPYGRDDGVFATVLGQIDEAVRALVGVLPAPHLG
jgi:protein-tyrosine phosphatase